MKAENDGAKYPVQITVKSRPALAAMALVEPFILISVTDPGADEAVYSETPLCRDVLRLQFDDAEYKGQTPRGKTLISKQDADAIRTFVRRHVTHATEPVQTIVCQCEMGRSRSAGIAAALARILQGDDETFFTDYSPNRWVYQTLLDRHALRQAQPQPKVRRGEEYGASRKWPFHISCGGAVYRDNGGSREYALLCRLPRSPDEIETWHLPKGTLHRNETLEQCALREITEESGRIVVAEAYLGSLHGQFTAPSGKWMDKATHYFLCRDHDATPQGMDDEHDRLEWFTAHNAAVKLEAEPKQEAEIILRAEQWLAQQACYCIANSGCKPYSHVV